MQEILKLCGMFAIVFAISTGVSYFLVSIRLRQRLPTPLPGGVLQLRSGVALYRSRFIRAGNNGWVIHAPLSRDSYVPLRVGEKLTVLMPTDAGLRHFETEITLRDSLTHELTIAVPVRMASVERRQSERVDKFLNPCASIEGRPATLVDLSPGGARLLSQEPILRGERAAVDLPEKGRVFGWILDSAPASPGYMMRVRFEEPLKL